MSELFLGRTETFWVGVQAIAAIVGLFGLLAYVLYTRSMMKLQDEARRASFTPILSIKQQEVQQAFFTPRDAHGNAMTDQLGQVLRIREPGSYAVRLVVSNIGQGPLTGVQAWHRQVSPAFGLKGNDIYARSEASVAALAAHMQLARDATEEFFLSPLKMNAPALIVVEGVDVARGRHQLQLLFSAQNEGGLDANGFQVVVRMIHASGDSFGERAVRVTRRLVNILNHLERVSREITNPD